MIRDDGDVTPPTPGTNDAVVAVYHGIRHK